MTYFAAIYSYHPTHPELEEVRPLHRQWVASLKEEGKIIGSGPFVNANGGALIVVSLPEGTTMAEAVALFDLDPFWERRIVHERVIREWNPVINSFPAEG